MTRRVLVLLVFALAALGLTAPLQPAPRDDALYAGFGETDVTPKLGDRPVFIAGFGTNRKATGVHDPLMARAIVLRHGDRKVAIASVDLVGLFHPLVVRVRARLPGFDYVLVTSTHNHEGPDTLGLWGPTRLQSGVDIDYLKQVEAGIVDAVTAADKALRPVTARIGSATAPELLHDGREPIVKHDELVALQFLDPRTEKPAGLIVQWNCHPETLDSKNTLISADYVGYTVKHLRDRYTCPVVYLTGTVGGGQKCRRQGAARGHLRKDGTLRPARWRAGRPQPQGSQANRPDASGSTPPDHLSAAGKQGIPGRAPGGRPGP
jgi:hypothetical protein